MALSALDGLNIKLLRVFETVARHGSFSRAASELGRSPATVSEQVRDLEAQLDVRLVERTTRAVALTEAGQVLADSLTSGLATIAAGVEALRSQAEERRVRLLIACVPSLSSVHLPRMLARYLARNPAMRIEVRELTSAEIVTAVTTDAVEFGIGPCADPPPSDVGFTPVVEEPLHALVPRALAEGWSGTLPFSALAALPLVMLPGSVLLQRMLAEAAARNQLDLKPQTEVRHVQTAIAMAAAGVGAAIVPQLALPEVAHPGTVCLRITEPALIRHVGIITRRGQPLRPTAVRLARYVSSSLAEAGRVAARTT